MKAQLVSASFLVLSSALQVFAQEGWNNPSSDADWAGSEKALVVPLIGDTLDATERRLFRLLPQYPGLIWAVFHQSKTDTLSLSVCFEIDGTVNTLHIYPFLTLPQLNEHLRSVVQATLEGDAGVRRGTFVTLEVRGGLQMTREILSVGDSSIILGSEENLLEDVSVLSSKEVERIFTRGKSHLVLGATVGAGVGIGAAAIRQGIRHSGSSNTSGEWKEYGRAMNGLYYGGALVAGALVGLAAAAIVDGIVSQDSVLFKNGGDLSQLKPMGRYVLEPPPFLREVAASGQ